jgi:hypothetical protein
LNHEVILDWTNFQLFDLRLDPSNRCLSGHRRFELIDVEAGTETPLAGLFDIADGQFGAPASLAGFLHPLNVQAYCPCGQVSVAAGTAWAAPPRCPDCREPMQWLPETQCNRMDRPLAEELAILDKPLGELGFPAGGMFLARSPGKPPKRLLLRGND